MRKNWTELVFILDRSGSMAGLESDTIGGFNGMLQKQRAVGGGVTVTTVLFDDKYELLHDRIDIQGVQPMTDRQYYVRGCTALLDAVGKTICKIKAVQANTSEEMRAEKVIFVIITDGFENASREFRSSQVKEMIEHQKEAGWEFLFLGANMDAVSEAGKIGIAPSRAVTYNCDSEGTQLNYRVVSEAVCRMRCETAPLAADWKQEIEEDCEKRARRFHKYRDALK